MTHRQPIYRRSDAYRVACGNFCEKLLFRFKLQRKCPKKFVTGAHSILARSLKLKAEKTRPNDDH